MSDVLETNLGGLVGNEQPLDSLRHISRQVDVLLSALSDNGGPQGGSGSGVARPPSEVIERSLLSHLQGMVSLLEPNELMERIVETALATTGGERAFLMLLEEGNKLRFKTGRNIDHRDLARKEFGGARLLIKKVLQEGRPALLSGNDLPSHGLIHLHGVLCAPIKFGKRLDGNQRVHGAVYVDRVSKGEFGSNQLERLSLLADHAAIALENAQILNTRGGETGELIRLKGNLARLYEVGRSINSTLILNDLLVTVVDHIVAISRAQRGFIMLLEGSTGHQHLVFKVGRDARKNAIEEEAFRYSTTIAERAIDERMSIVIVEPLGEDLSLSMVQMELQSIMCVPLLEKEEVIGVVYVDSRQRNREFDEADREVVESLCGQAAVAIINAKLYQEAGERERLTHELNIAARLQRDMLPKEIPPVRGLELHGRLTSALAVGGDYYDFIPHEGTDESLTVAIGDVSGKGVAAGLVMAMARSALRSLVQHHGSPKNPLPLMRSLNVMLCRDIPREMFMTMTLLIWNANDSAFAFTGAGHEHLLVYRHDRGEVEATKAGGVACGVLESASDLLSVGAVEMQPGDHLLLYTDGVTETMDLLHQPFGLEAVIELLRVHGHRSPAELCEKVEQALIEYRGPADPHDDITLVALKRI